MNRNANRYTQSKEICVFESAGTFHLMFAPGPCYDQTCHHTCISVATHAQHKSMELEVTTTITNISANEKQVQGKLEYRYKLTYNLKQQKEIETKLSIRSRSRENKRNAD